MSDRAGRIGGLIHRDRIRTGLLVENQGIAGDIRLGIIGLGGMIDPPAVIDRSAVTGDGFRNDRARGIRREMDHLGPGILDLSFTRDRHGDT